jgi:hypothetical protein
MFVSACWGRWDYGKVPGIRHIQALESSVPQLPLAERQHFGEQYLRILFQTKRLEEVGQEQWKLDL